LGELLAQECLGGSKGTIVEHKWKVIFRALLSDVKALESRGRHGVLGKAARIGAFPILRLETWRA
jgi:hypothetical protein